MLTRRDLPQLVKKITSLTFASRNDKTRIQILEEAAGTSCTCPTPNTWFDAATEVVNFNDYTNQEIQKAVLNALENGRDAWSYYAFFVFLVMFYSPASIQIV